MIPAVAVFSFEYFATIEVKAVPQGGVTNPDDLKGKFIIKTLDEGQYLFKSLTGNEMVKEEKPELAPAIKPDPKELLSAKPAEVTPLIKYPRFDTTIIEAGQARRVIWLEVAPSKWKRFDSEREAAAYKPEENQKSASE